MTLVPYRDYFLIRNKCFVGHLQSMLNIAARLRKEVRRLQPFTLAMCSEENLIPAVCSVVSLPS